MLFFYMLLVRSQVPSEKPQGNVGYLADVGYVSTPFQVI